MDRPFDAFVVGLLRDQGAIAKVIAKGATESREVRSFSLPGVCGSQDQRDQGDGRGRHIDLGDGYLSTKFYDLLQELLNVLWENESSQRAMALEIL